MKTTLKYFASFVLVASALMSCNKETLNPNENSDAKDYVKVTLGVDTKAAMTDEFGMVWEEGDVIQWRGTTGNVDYTLKKSDISEDGYSTTFSLAIPNIANETVKGVFRYNRNGNDEFAFTDAPKNNGSAALSNGILSVVQENAGEMNRTAIFLHSGTSNCVTFEQGTTEIKATIGIAGSIVRLLPYTTEYNEEIIESISLSSNSYISGTIAYDYAAGTYRGVNDVNWLKIKKYTVSLTNPMSLSGVDARDKSAGFYMSLPATNGENNQISGYTIVVNTDKARYTYETASDLVLNESTVKNIYLKLDESHRVSNDAILGALRYTGALADNQSYTFTSTGETVAYNYWYAQVQKTGESGWTTMEANPNVTNGDPDFYTNVKFEAIDDATGEIASWCTAKYRDNDTWVLVTTTDNTSSESRSATITITYDSVKGYIIEPESKTKVIKAVQLGLANLNPSISYDGTTTISSEAGQYIATLNLLVNGVPATDAEYETFASQYTISGTDCSVKRSGKTLTIGVAKNPTTSPREIRISVSANAGSDELVLTQEASAEATTLRFSYTFGAWQEGLNGTRFINYSKDGKTGEWLAVFYNLTKDGIAYTEALSEVDTKALVMQMLNITEQEYDNSFLKFRIDGYNGEVKLLVDIPANPTSEARSMSGYVWYADQSSYITEWRFSQDAGPAE